MKKPNDEGATEYYGGQTMTPAIHSHAVRPHLRLGPLLDQYAYTFSTDATGVPGHGLKSSRGALMRFAHAVAMIVSERGGEEFMRELDAEEGCR